MEQKEKPIFTNDLSEEEQKKQDLAYAKEQESQKKAQFKSDIIVGVVDGITAIIDLIAD